MKKLILIFVIIFFVPNIVDAAFPYPFNDFGYCRKLTMTPGGASGGVATTTTSGFPLVATSTISTLAATSSAGRIQKYNYASSTPIDLVVTNGTDCNTSGGSVIDYYFEYYASTTGQFVLWSQPTNISSTTNKTILLYYGNAGATDLQNKNGVWDKQGEVSVWNLGEGDSTSAGFYDDSTSNNNDMTLVDANGNSTASTGYVDGGIDLNGDADYLNVSNPSSLNITGNNLTMMAWVLEDVSTGAAQIFIAKPVNNSTHTSPYFQYSIHDADAFGGLRACVTTGGSLTCTSGGPTAVYGAWTHAVGVYNGTDLKFYKNGVEVASNGLTGNINSYTTDVRLGTNGGLGEIINGKIDDTRIYNRAMSAMDVLTVYNNTKSSTIFWTFGSEETPTTPPASNIISRFLIRWGAIKINNGRVIIK